MQYKTFLDNIRSMHKSLVLDSSFRVDNLHHGLLVFTKTNAAAAVTEAHPLAVHPMGIGWLLVCIIDEESTVVILL